jgi:hypothetical protein
MILRKVYKYLRTDMAFQNAGKPEKNVAETRKNKYMRTEKFN